MELRSQNGIDLHVEQVRRKRLTLINEDSLSSLGMFKDEILEELKNVKYHDLEYLVYTFQLTCDEIIDILDLKNKPTKIRSYSLKHNIYQISDINNTQKNILPDNVKISGTIDEKNIYPI